MEFQATIIFEADSLEDAAAVMAGWTLSPGAVVRHAHTTQPLHVMTGPVEVGEDGTVGEITVAQPHEQPSSLRPAPLPENPGEDLTGPVEPYVPEVPDYVPDELTNGGSGTEMM